MHIPWICKRSCSKCLQNVEIRDKCGNYYLRHCVVEQAIWRIHGYNKSENLWSYGR